MTRKLANILPFRRAQRTTEEWLADEERALRYRYRDVMQAPWLSSMESEAAEQDPALCTEKEPK